MRKVLLRIVFDPFWNLQNANNELLVGVGWVLALWSLFGIFSLTRQWNSTRELKEILSSLLFWLILPAVIVAAAVFAPTLVQNGVPVFGYGFMLLIGFSSGTLLAIWHARRIDMNPTIISDLMMWVLIPGLIGARLFFVIQYSDRLFPRAVGLKQKLITVLSVSDGGLVFYGSVFGGVIGGLVFCHRRKIRPLQLADVVMPSLLVGLGFGRIGCFLYGCCFGGPCNLPWAVRFPPGSAAYGAQLNAEIIENGAASTTALHPTQIYSSILAFVLAGVLTWVFRRRAFEGLVTGLTLVLYPVNRFLLEIIRDDEPGVYGTVFTISQLISMVLSCLGLAMLVWLTLRNQRVTRPDCPREQAIAGKSSRVNP